MPRQVAIAVGAALLATAFVVIQFRMDTPWATGVLFLVAAVPAAVMLGAGLRDTHAEPRAEASALLLGGLAVVAVADFRLLQLLGSDDPFDVPRSLTAFFAILAAIALFTAWRSRSAACLLVGALASGGTVLAAVRWVFDTENIASYRPALLVLAALFAAAAWALRGAPRHRDVLVDAAGLALLALAQLGGGILFFGFFGESMPGFWEVVVILGATGLVAYTARTRAPGPGVIAIVLLAVFASTIAIEVTADVINGDEGGDATLIGWPLVLLVAGGAALAYGLTSNNGAGAEDPTDVTREVRL